MAYYARKIKYGGNETSFTALVEIARRKGGEPIKFVLYQFNGNRLFDENKYEMIEFGSKERENAVESFPCGLTVHEEKSYFEELNKDLNFPRRRKNLWQKTTNWLNKVAVGGSYEVYSPGTWVKIGKKNSCKKRREKRGKRLKFGNLGHILLAAKKELKSLKEELIDMKTIERTSEEKREMQKEKIEKYQNRIDCLVEEMKYAKAKKLGILFVKHTAV